jgi:hypothetical protein
MSCPHSVRKGVKIGYQWTIEYNFTLGDAVPTFTAMYLGKLPAFVEVVSALITPISEPLGGSFSVAFGNDGAYVDIGANDGRQDISDKLAKLPGINSERLEAGTCAAVLCVCPPGGSVWLRAAGRSGGKVLLL